jgi:Ca2+-binding EF-hand superfamily protein
VFKDMDRNGNGTIEPIEFKYCMRVWGVELTEEEVSQIVKYFDTNKDGKISFDEFLGAI